MDNGIYVALSKQLGQFRTMNIIADNMANVNTLGHKKQDMLFRNFLVPEGNGKRVAFTQDYLSYRNTNEGKLSVTGNNLDFAISGGGYFQVQSPLGERYTRAGNFQVDGEGYMVTTQGYRVLDAGGQPIQFQEEDVAVEVRGGGEIVVDGEERGQLGIVRFEDEQSLRRVGDNLYMAEGQGALPVDQPVVLQGMLESSNVEPILEITNMITTSRSVSSTGRFIETSYDLQKQAIATLAKQPK